MTTIYFVLAGFGRLGTAWVERDEKDATRERTLAALVNREWADVRCVMEMNRAKGTARDVTDEMQAVAELVREFSVDWMLTVNHACETVCYQINAG